MVSRISLTDLMQNCTFKKAQKWNILIKILTSDADELIIIHAAVANGGFEVF